MFYSCFIIMWPSFHDCFLSLIFSIFKINLFPHVEFCIFCSNTFCIAFLSFHALKTICLPFTMYFSVYRYFFPGIHYFFVQVKSKILSTLNSNDSLSLLKAWKMPYPVLIFNISWLLNFLMKSCSVSGILEYPNMS